MLWHGELALGCKGLVRFAEPIVPEKSRHVAWLDESGGGDPGEKPNRPRRESPLLIPLGVQLLPLLLPHVALGVRSWCRHLEWSQG